MRLGAWWYRLKAGVLTVFGDISVYRWPMFLVYNPKSYKVKGRHCREILGELHEGDVLLRGYDDYLDSYFIPLGESRCSHSGVYAGGGMVVHSVAEGVVKEDVLDFCRADRVAVLRPRVEPLDKLRAVELAEAKVGKPYDFDFMTTDTEDSNTRNNRYFCHELTRSCFPGIRVERKVGRARFLGLRSNPIYLADSFYSNKCFEIIYKSWSR